MTQANLISHLEQILEGSLGEPEAAACLAEVLNAALRNSIIDVKTVKDISGEAFSAVLEAAWAWRLLVPLR